MSCYHPIEEVANRLRDEFDWAHSFIRECYVTSARALRKIVDSEGRVRVGDSEGTLAARLIVSCAGNDVDLGIEFVFQNIGAFVISWTQPELQFEHAFDARTGHLVRFSAPDDEYYITAESVSVRFLGREYTGMRLWLGYECPSSEAYDAEAIAGWWRQCSLCANAWEENPKLEFSRCPECEALTRLIG